MSGTGDEGVSPNHKLSSPHKAEERSSPDDLAEAAHTST